MVQQEIVYGLEENAAILELFTFGLPARVQGEYSHYTTEDSPLVMCYYVNKEAYQ